MKEWLKDRFLLTGYGAWLSLAGGLLLYFLFGFQIASLSFIGYALGCIFCIWIIGPIIDRIFK